MPLNSAASKLLHKAAKNTAPNGGCYRHRCISEVQRKKDAERQVQLHTRMESETTVAVQRITEYLRSTSVDHGLPRKKREITDVACPRPKQQKIEVDLPEPRDKSTMMYSRPEAVSILADATIHGSKERRAMMDVMIDKGWASTSVYTLRRLLKQRANIILVLDVPCSGNGNNGGGTWAFLSRENIDNLVGEWKRGEAHGRDAVTKVVSRVANETIWRLGGVPFRLSRKSSKTIVTNIRAAIANHDCVSLANKVTKKTDHRIIAEASLSQDMLSHWHGTIYTCHFCTGGES